MGRYPRRCRYVGNKRMLPYPALPSSLRGSVGSDPLAMRNAVLNRTSTTTMSTTIMTFTWFAKPFFCGSHIQRDAGLFRVVLKIRVILYCYVAQGAVNVCKIFRLSLSLWVYDIHGRLYIRPTSSFSDLRRIFSRTIRNN